MVDKGDLQLSDNLTGILCDEAYMISMIWTDNPQPEGIWNLGQLQLSLMVGWETRWR